jgi:hypothetical protein
LLKLENLKRFRKIRFSRVQVTNLAKEAWKKMTQKDKYENWGFSPYP